MTDSAPPTLPTGTCAVGRRLCEPIKMVYLLDEHELAVLREATRTVDVLKELEAAVGSFRRAQWIATARKRITWGPDQRAATDHITAGFDALRSRQRDRLASTFQHDPQME